MKDLIACPELSHAPNQLVPDCNAGRILRAESQKDRDVLQRERHRATLHQSAREGRVPLENARARKCYASTKAQDVEGSKPI